MSEIRRNYVTMYLVLLALGEIQKKGKQKEVYMY